MERDIICAYFSYIGFPCRLDKILGHLYLGISRSSLQKKEGIFLVNGKEVRSTAVIHARDVVNARVRLRADGDLSKHGAKATRKDEDEKRTMVNDRIYEDDYLLVINKRRGDVVHFGAGVCGPTVAEAVAPMVKQTGWDTVEYYRRGIVHRIDKETTGVLLVAKTPEAHTFYSRQFAQRKVKKTYVSIVKGIPREQTGIVHTMLVRDKRNRKKYTNKKIPAQHAYNLADRDKQIKGKFALSRYVVVHSSRGCSLVLWNIITGRTHQIRTHALYIGTPIVGDRLYARAMTATPFERYSLMLHAWKLSTTLYGAKQPEERKEFCAELPEDMKEALHFLGADFFLFD